MRLKQVKLDIRNRVFEHFQGTTPLASVDISYENSSLPDFNGKFYIRTRGVMKMLVFSYVGSIKINPAYNINSKIVLNVYGGRRTVII